MNTVQLNVFDEAHRVKEVVSMVENIVIDSLSTESNVVYSFISNLLSTSTPNTIFSEKGLVKLWTEIRNNKQELIDWFLDTYRKIYLAVSSDKIMDMVRNVYAGSLYIGDVEALYKDDDLGSRLPSIEVLQAMMSEHKWTIIIAAIYSIDMTDVEKV